MNEKRNWKQGIKDWWQENKRVIKTGVACGLAGLAYGFIKGSLTVADMVLRGDMYVQKADPVDWDADTGLTEENCDDPELLELVNGSDSENS